MPLNLASPGIVVREVDLTNGRIDPTTDKIGAIVAPFTKGPVNQPTLIENEQELLDTFGGPSQYGNHYEHWLAASSFLAYGGGLRVVRASGSSLTNAKAGTASSITLNSLDDYVTRGFDDNTINGIVVAARDPGAWGNSLQVAIIDGAADQILTGINTSTYQVGYGVTQTLDGKTLIGSGTTSSLEGAMLKGVITEVGVGNSTIKVKVNSYVDAAGTETRVDYTPNSTWAFTTSGGTLGVHTNGYTAAYESTTYDVATDWFDAQTIEVSSAGVSTTTIKWNNIAPRPGTSAYAEARNARHDEVHVVVIDSDGSITGTVGTVLEKHLALSKATDAVFSVGSPAYWRKYIANGSQYIFAGGAPAGITTTGFSSGFTLQADDGWDQAAEGIVFSGVGNTSYVLSTGADYDGTTTGVSSSALTSALADRVGGYDLFTNTEEYDIDFLIMGGAEATKEATQAVASKLIAVAEERQDAIAFISPHRQAFLNNTGADQEVVSSTTTMTDNVLDFYAPLPSSSYAVFDSGYKYMYDRFANTFRYVPLNGDIAGTCARNDINNFPWFSPAGTARGSILNAVKLVYNPNKTQRDVLYSNRVNPVILSPGAGIVLFGDKTALAKSSAFDRINVRRLFLYLEDAISAAAKDQLFEFNDEITRTNFVNIIEPFLRDVQAKRGISDYVVVCDETNNTAAVIDNNEFVADIFVKPARSINFIGLTFVATRTGVAFEEVIGNV